jgi:nicotinamide riboside transporter PnuC
VRRPFQIRHHCPACRALFKREEGFFVGAIVANVLTTELAVLVTYFAGLLVAGSYFDSLIAVLLCVAVLFPVAFYHHSWSVWLGADYLIESLPKFGGRDED